MPQMQVAKTIIPARGRKLKRDCALRHIHTGCKDHHSREGTETFGFDVACTAAKRVAKTIIPARGRKPGDVRGGDARDDRLQRPSFPRGDGNEPLDR